MALPFGASMIHHDHGPDVIPMESSEVTNVKASEVQEIGQEDEDADL